MRAIQQRRVRTGNEQRQSHPESPSLAAWSQSKTFPRTVCPVGQGKTMMTTSKHNQNHAGITVLSTPYMPLQLWSISGPY